MNLHRLLELAKAGKDGTIQPEELQELFEALPSVFEAVAFVEKNRDVMLTLIKAPLQCGHSREQIIAEHVARAHPGK